MINFETNIQFLKTFILILQLNLLTWIHGGAYSFQLISFNIENSFKEFYFDCQKKLTQSLLVLEAKLSFLYFLHKRKINEFDL